MVSSMRGSFFFGNGDGRMVVMVMGWGAMEKQRKEEEEKTSFSVVHFRKGYPLILVTSRE